MTWISLVCLLALSSSAFSRSIGFSTPLGGGYGGAAFQLPSRVITSVQRPLTQVVSSGYGGQTELITPAVQTETLVAPGPVTKVLSGGYGGYGGARALLEQPTLLPTQTTVVSQGPAIVTPAVPLTEADLACRGQLPETVIPVDGGQRFFVCLDDGKGAEQFCQKGLIYSPAGRRCERRTGPFDACASQPCLNGGVCLNSDYTYQCQCQVGFDGNNCELDARICHTQNPCGVGPGTKCQSFRWGAALEYLCVYQNGDGYGPNANQIHNSPCAGIDGPHQLAFTNKGFVMCDGERAFYESCPGGTIWHDLTKACVWPDMIPLEIATPVLTQRTLIGNTGYGGGYGGAVAIEQPKLLTKVGGYGGVAVAPRVFQGGYGGEIAVAPRVLEPVRQVVSGGYGGEIIATGPKVFHQGGYGGEVAIATGPKVLQGGYGGEIIATGPKVLQGGYGGEVAISTGPKVLQQGYGGEVIATGPKVLHQGGYGGEVAIATGPKVLTQGGYGGEIAVAPRVLEPVRQVVSGGYGGVAVAPRVHFEQPKIVSSYGGPREEVIVKQGY